MNRFLTTPAGPLVHRPAWAAAVLAGCLVLAGCSDDRPAGRKQQVVKLLPDTPPPPPPPPKPQDKPPPPKPDDKPAPPAPKTPEPQQAQMLKSDEAPGSGPGGGLVAGEVKQEYSGQPVGTGGGGGPALGANRLAAASYASTANRELSDFLQGDKTLRRHGYRLQVHLWLDERGRISRAELMGSSGDASVDAALREALQRFPGTRSEPPAGLPQPLRVQLSNRMIG